MSHKYKTLRVGDPVDTPYGLGHITEVKGSSAVRVAIGHHDTAGGSWMGRDNVDPVIVMNSNKTVAFSAELRDIPEWVLDAADAINRFMDARTADHWVIGGIEKRRSDAPAPITVGSKWRRNVDHAPITVSNVHPVTNEVSYRYDSGIIGTMAVKGFRCHFKPAPDEPISMSFDDGAWLQHAARKIQDRMSKYGRGWYVNVSAGNLDVSMGEAPSLDAMRDAPGSDLSYTPHDLSYTPHDVPDIGSKWVSKSRPESEVCTVSRILPPLTYPGYQQIVAAWPDGGETWHEPALFLRDFMPAPTGTDPSTVDGFTYGRPLLSRLDAAKPAPVDTNPSTADVPDDELREQLAACREDWAALCEVLDENGAHLDPDVVLARVLALINRGDEYRALVETAQAVASDLTPFGAESTLKVKAFREALRPFAPEKPPRTPQVGDIWKHYNSGEYTVRKITNTEFINPDYPVTVVYRRGPSWWSRPLDSWHRSFTFVCNPITGEKA